MINSGRDWSWTKFSTRKDGPVWKQVRDAIAEQIEAGFFGPGEMLPSETDMIGMFGIGRSTARRVMKELRKQRLVYTVPRYGSFVMREDGSLPPDAVTGDDE